MAEVYGACSPSGKIYVGYTTGTVLRRWRRHVSDAMHGRQSRLNSAILKYGGGQFILVTLAQGIPEDRAKGLEIQWIADLDLQNPDNGYNMTKGGDGLSGWVPSEFTRNKWRKNCRGPKSLKHIQHMTEANRRPEHILSVVVAVRGRPKSEEHRRKLAAQRGWRHSEEARYKMRLAWQRRKEQASERVTICRNREGTIMTGQEMLEKARQRAAEMVEESSALSDAEFDELLELQPEKAVDKLAIQFLETALDDHNYYEGDDNLEDGQGGDVDW